jgi:hypothetical protein
MLNADPALENRVVMVGDVAGGVDALEVRAAVLVDDDAIVDLDAGSDGELRREPTRTALSCSS